MLVVLFLQMDQNIDVEYKYIPSYQDDIEEQKEEFHQVDEGEPIDYPDKIPASTSLEILDRIQTPILTQNPMAKGSDLTDDPYLSVIPETGTYSRLQYLTDKENKKRLSKHKTFSNLSVREFFKKITDSLLDTLDDLLSFNPLTDSLVDILSKEDRLLSIGVLLITISVFSVVMLNLR
ncbi:MAG TPA: hypothetical protein V6C58_17685 [Allocoleopsis sp.]